MDVSLRSTHTSITRRNSIRQKNEQSMKNRSYTPPPQLHSSLLSPTALSPKSNSLETVSEEHQDSTQTSDEQTQLNSLCVESSPSHPTEENHSSNEMEKFVHLRKRVESFSTSDLYPIKNMEEEVQDSVSSTSLLESPSKSTNLLGQSSEDDFSALNSPSSGDSSPIDSPIFRKNVPLNQSKRHSLTDSLKKLSSYFVSPRSSDNEGYESPSSSI